ncbi:hypothetical protein EON82_00490 [bacterium]|nr:MAG: hypothetical protein EON82_00490 [bacterium]
MRPPLAKPTDLVTAAAYLHAGAERIIRGPVLRRDEVTSLLAITTAGARQEPDNAFWSMAEFVFRGGTSKEALKAWSAASRCRLYNDHQSQALEQDRIRIASHYGGVQAWIYAAIGPQRSESLARLLLSNAQRAQKKSKSIDLAYQTIRNGAMLRDGSRRLSLGMHGISLIESATYPPELQSEASPRRLWVAKTDLTGKLRRAGRVTEASFCDRQFRINDSWQAFRDVEDPAGRLMTLSVAASIVDALPGGLLTAAVAGAIVWLFSLRVAKVAEYSDRFRGPGLTACSLALLVCAAGLGYPGVGLATGVCALVPALSPERPRRYDGSPLGPLHAFAVGSMVTALMAGVALTAVARSLPGQVLPSQGTWGAFLGDPRRLAAFIVVILGGSALIAPAWATVRRLGTPAVAATTYGSLGRGLALVSLLFAIVASPISVAVDRILGDHLGKIVLNEQVYYNPSDSGSP